MFKRIAFGLSTTALIAAALGVVPSFLPETWAAARLAGYFHIWPALAAAFGAFLAALGGAYVARVPFAIPAVLFAIGAWMFVIYLLNSIAGAAGQSDILAIAGANALGLLFGIAGAAAGAYVGERLSPAAERGIANGA